MAVINLLPWRRTRVKRRLRHFLLTLLAVATLAAMLSLLHYSSNSHQRRHYEARLTELDKTLVQLQNETRLLLQRSAGITQSAGQLLALQQRWQQQYAWQRLILQWQALAAVAHIAGIDAHDGSVVLSGISHDVSPLRSLLHQSAGWQLQQIVLDAESGFHFTAVHSLQTEGLAE